jgi:hypothetical protein
MQETAGINCGLPLAGGFLFMLLSGFGLGIQRLVSKAFRQIPATPPHLTAMQLGVHGWLHFPS